MQPPSIPQPPQVAAGAAVAAVAVSHPSSLPSHTQQQPPPLVTMLQADEKRQMPLVEDVDDEYDYEALPKNTSLASNLMAGAFAGIMEHTVMYPVDAIKTRMQVVSVSNTGYTGISNAISRISATEGARALWRGITSVAIGAGPAHAVYFSVYEFTKNAFGGNEGTGYHPIATSLAGACATIASDALMNPFDVIKQRMQLAGSRFPNIAACAGSVYRNEGFSAFYISYPTTLFMNIPLTALNFTTYEALSKLLNPHRRYDPLTHCVAGGLAGAVAAAVTTPMDVIKTFLQTKGSSQDIEIRRARSLVDAARIIYQREGLSGFMRGLRPRIIANMPSTAICWTSYEMAKFYLYKSW
ncbi:mitochondrial carrier domain-containing protein [Lipomyces tetrasporus]|uniref:Mitochondrial carrier domain-containing protein n=1 Tax=Lipomyces tetrasporus TaxID=54092 RepID=A0AAD7VVD3_9ASCO|nr:mitochondrial carrier domain-containing protein [Lipomyces tetrasporus]KAJ8102849.1 mitochondrial carrier domain-containing protein [Lipomyces tetrasporus]